MELLFTGFMAVLTAASLSAPWMIEGIKKALDKKKKEYDVNALSLIFTAVYTLGLSVGYTILFDLGFNPKVLVMIIATIFFGCIGSLCRYDKMFKFIFEAIRKKKGNK